MQFMLNDSLLTGSACVNLTFIERSTNELRVAAETLQCPLTPKRKLKFDDQFFVFQKDSVMNDIDCQEVLVQMKGDLDSEVSNLTEIKEDITARIDKYQRFSLMCQQLTPVKITDCKL